MIERITLALPSKGAIAEPTINFLKDCGLRVDKPNPRQYTGSVPAISTLDVLFQRVIDIVYKVADGTAQLGITGLDVVHEYAQDDLIVIHNDLNYGHCKLLVAVPESWVDVITMADLADVSLDFREYNQRNLRVATTYTNQARQFLHAHGIHHFTLVSGEGAIEAAPTIGYADIIVDLTQTGTTLRENHLKPLSNGVIVSSQACLIGNRRFLESEPTALEATRVLLEYMDSSLRGRDYSQVTVNICGTDVQSVARKVMSEPVTRGLQGPTIAPIYGGSANTDENWFTLTLILENKQLMKAVEHLRAQNATDVVVTPVRYIFSEYSPTYNELLKRLNMPR
jgi:ATP phosphoribosyltransferase